MADEEQLRILKQGPNEALAKSRSQRSVAAWNAWRGKQAPDTGIDLSDADLRAYQAERRSYRETRTHCGTYNRNSR